MKAGFIPGTMLDGRYEAVSLLNHGSFGMVFLAKDHSTGEEVAIKCLSKVAATKDCPSIDVDENSVEIACHLRLGCHSNIVNLIRSFETSAHIYLILEYCPMGDLYEAIRLDRGPRETKNVQDFMLQLVGAVEFMHSKGFYHRDIKPENIFLMQDGSMKLGDLGLATSDAWSYEASVGSDRYMAPEQYAFSENAGYSPAQADIWAIGICLLNVLFSRNPFVTPTESDKLFADFARDHQSLFDIFPNMSQDTFNVLVHAMTIDPSKRSLSGVRQALENVVSFTTEEDVLDDFCTEVREVAPASANREPLRTPSISSPHVDQGGAFPWSMALHMSPARQTRQLSTVLDTESYTEDLFPVSEKNRDSWYSEAQNSSMTSGLDSTSGFGTSYKSISLGAPAPRNPPQSKPVPVPSSLPARMANLSSLFGKKGSSAAKSWTDIWDEDEDEDEEDTTQDGDFAKIREQNSRTWSQESKDNDTTLRRTCISELNLGTTSAPSPTKSSHSQHPSADGDSDHGMFVFEDAAPRYSPPPKRTIEFSPPPRRSETPRSKRNIIDKWSALGNRRRQFSQGAGSHGNGSSHMDEVKGKWTNSRDWRAGFGLKVFSGNGGRMGGFSWDKDKDSSSSSRKETANAKVRSWRQGTLESPADRGHLLPAADVEWVGGL